MLNHRSLQILDLSGIPLEPASRHAGGTGFYSEDRIETTSHNSIEEDPSVEIIIVTTRHSTTDFRLSPLVGAVMR
jgi:hypothetical protein